LNTDAESQLWALLEALKTVKQGDFSVRLPVANNGVMGEIAEAFNDVVSLNASMANEIGRVSKIVGEEGKLPRSCL
jgi:methyl-accepting chemotaxis protein